MANAQLGTVLQQLRKLVNATAGGAASDGELLARFAKQRDESAFVTLLQRHGPMVLHVCRRVSRQEQDAEDAFQATFLLLASKPGSIRKQGSIASWLHGVAYRLALATRSRENRRQTVEHRAANRRAASEARQPAWQDLRMLLDEALQHMPLRYRTPLILCYLQGKTQEEAAQALHCPLGTVRSRLARGRARLKLVLERQGLQLPVTGMATALAANDGSAAVPALLLSATAKAALGVAAGEAPGTLVSARVAALVQGGLQALTMTKLKIAAASFLVICVLGLGAGLAATRGIAGSEADSSPVSQPAETKPSATGPRAAPRDDVLMEAADRRTVRGRVLSPDGKPVANARIYQRNSGGDLHQATEVQVALTGPDGQFEVEAAHLRSFSAVADGFAPDWTPPDLPSSASTFTLKLASDDPIRGRLLNLEGKPVPGAKVHVLAVNSPPNGNLQGAYDAFRLNPEWTWQALGKRLDGASAAMGKGPTTNADGRFELKGIGRGRVVELRFEADGIEAAKVYVFNDPDFDSKKLLPATNRKNANSFLPGYRPTVVGPTFTYAANPSHDIAGAVRDRVTGAPIAGVEIVGAGPGHSPGQPTWDNRTRTRTDGAGRFRLSGLPKAQQRFLHVQAGATPYLDQVVEVKDVEALTPVSIEIKLQHCVTVEGRLIDKVSGRPVKGYAHYMPMANNTQLKSMPDDLLYNPGQFSARPTDTWVSTDDHGGFRVRVIRGSGVILAWADTFLAPAARYAIAHVADADRKYLKPPPPPGVMRTKVYPQRREDEEYFDTAMVVHPLSWVNGYAIIDPSERDDRVTCTIQFDPGTIVSGRVVDPDGKPLLGTKAVGIQATNELSAVRLVTDRFAVYALDAYHERTVFFIHEERKLAGMLTLRADEKSKPVVSLRPWAGVTGRVLSADGTPAAGLQAVLRYDKETDQLLRQNKLSPASEPVETDKDGCFRFDGLFPGYPATVFISKPGHRSIAMSFPGRARLLGRAKTWASGGCLRPVNNSKRARSRYWDQSSFRKIVDRLSVLGALYSAPLDTGGDDGQSTTGITSPADTQNGFRRRRRQRWRTSPPLRSRAR